VYEGYLSYGGHEIINNARAFAYATALGIATPLCGPCPTLLRAVGDPQGYTTPAADDAPWYDPARPESAGFAGLLGLRISGVTDGVSTQTFTETADGRAVPGAVRAYSREVQVEAELLATDDAAMSYGRAWLAAALRGERCAPGCAGTQLCGFTACPPDCPVPDSGQPDPCGDAQWRTMNRAGVIVAPRRQRLRHTSDGGVLCQMDFTFRVGDPYLWTAPLLLGIGPTGAQALPEYTDSGLPPDCGTVTDCVRDPLCPPPLAPLLPPPAVDLCYPTGAFTARRWVMNLPSGLTPAWFEKVPYVRINPGALDLRRLRLRWYHNPLGADCSTVLDPCLSCGEVQVPYLPRNSWFVLDGRTETATVDCASGPGVRNGDVPVYGPGGAPYTWPTFGCEVPTCLEITALASSVAPDARWEISTVVREEAA
jgi:hypothetical protein